MCGGIVWVYVHSSADLCRMEMIISFFVTNIKEDSISLYPYGACDNVYPCDEIGLTSRKDIGWKAQQEEKWDHFSPLYKNALLGNWGQYAKNAISEKFFCYLFFFGFLGYW